MAKAAAPPIRRRKPKAARKESSILIRVTAAQKRELVQAADAAGLDLSSWLRALGLQAARQGATTTKSTDDTEE